MFMIATQRQRSLMWKCFNKHAFIHLRIEHDFSDETKDAG